MRLVSTPPLEYECPRFQSGKWKTVARIVKKFGGTSVADLARIRAAAAKVKAAVDEGHEVLVVVSAMAGVTNQLVGYVNDTAPIYDAREYDSVVAAGEQISSGLFALALQEMGVDARSWLGWQVPVRTSGAHASARILDIETAELVKRMEAGQVGVVAGFQGLGPDNRITTLGRGGSDTSAVAFAAALKADRCDIYTDVDGVYTTDPRIVKAARKLDKVSYEEMLEMASVGAKVLQTRSVELAMRMGVRLRVLSSFENGAGTLIVDEDEIVEQAEVTGVAYSLNDAKITLLQVEDQPGVAAAIFGALAEANINVDMIVQNISENGRSTDMTFTVAATDAARAKTVIEAIRETVPFKDILVDSKVAKISVVGVGMRSHAGVAQKMFATLAEKGINIQVISTSEIKISVLIAADYHELAVRALHAAYGLDAD